MTTATIAPTHDLNFHHVFAAGSAPEARTLLLLHGTGGNERDLLDLGRSLEPNANLLSPRGKVLEQGMPRFFRRLAEGVFDEQDLIARTQELASFIAAAGDRYHFDPATVTAVGFSNGANIAASLLLLRPESLGGAVLWRAMVPLIPEKSPDLAGKRILLTHGDRDPMIPRQNREQLIRMLRACGAIVEAHEFPSSHNLTQQDLDLTQRWLNT